MNEPIIIRNALSKDMCRLIEVYSLIREKRAEIYDDDTVAKREHDIVGVYSVYADPMSESLMLFLRKKIEISTGLDLLPTYSFYRVYQKGHSLIKHVDRESCEITASVFIGKSYGRGNWPLYIDNKEFSLDIGDMVVYKGTELAHWREPLDLDGYHIQAFLHYVDGNGPYKEFKFDKRKSIFHIERD